MNEVQREAIIKRYGPMAPEAVDFEHGQPLHSDRVLEAMTGSRENSWWACKHPERPHEDGKTCYNDLCRKCLIAIRAGIESGRIDLVHRGSSAGLAGSIHTNAFMADWSELWELAL